MTLPDLTPSNAIVAALAASCLLPILLALLSHGPWRVHSPGRRFVAAAALTWAAWWLVLAVLAPADIVDMTASFCWLAAATLAGWTFWTLLAWGFTLTLLVRLGEAAGPLRQDDWIQSYTGGRTLSALARDRLGVLLRLRLAVLCAGRVKPLRPWSSGLGRLATRLRRLFGVPQ